MAGQTLSVIDDGIPGSAATPNATNITGSVGASVLQLLGGVDGASLIASSGNITFNSTTTNGNLFLNLNRSGVTSLSIGTANNGTNAVINVPSANTSALTITTAGGTQAARAQTAIGSGTLTAVAGSQILVSIGGGAIASPLSGLTMGTFAPVYGTATYAGLQVAPTINQAAITGTIAGVEVAANVVTLVFSNDLHLTPMTNGATTVNANVVTNTAASLNPATLTTSIQRVNSTITNISETVGNVVTLTLTAGAPITANDYVYLSGLTVGTWLNGKVVKLTTGGSTTMTFTDPTSHGTQASAAETGTVVCSYIKYSKTTGNITLVTDTGTAVQQATGNVTDLIINSIETAIGGTHLLMDLQAGAAGTTRRLSITNLGVLNTYNSIVTVGDGVPYEVASVDLIAQTAAKTATIYTPTATQWFRINVYLKVTTPATTGAATSTLAGATGVTITYTDGTDSVAQSVVMSLTKQDGTVGINNAGNTTTTVLYGSIAVYAKTGVAIQYAIDYTSNTAAQMAYAARMRCEAM